MKTLIKKELTSIFCSGIGLIFALIFLLSCGAMLWFFQGNFNILDAGYSTLDNFFALAPMLLTVLTPALTMRLITEEKKNKTFDLLQSRPLSISTICLSKWIATFIFLFLVFLSSIIYVYTLYRLGSPMGNIDLHIVIASYSSLFLLAGVFTGIGILASSITSNQIVAFILALLLNFIVFYGINMFASIFTNGNIQIKINSIGLLHHYQQIKRGVIEVSNISVFIIYFIITWICSIIILSSAKKYIKTKIITAIISITAISTISIIFDGVHLDITKDKRYTLAEYSKELMREISKNEKPRIKINIYLEGNLNAGFQRLNNSISSLLSDLNKYANNKIEISRINPISLPIPKQQLSEYMAKHNMSGIALNQVDRDGKITQQIIYPYAEFISEKDTLQVSLLKNTPGNTAEENLNASAEDLEFQIVDALRLVSHNEEQNIAFIEGHGELARAYVYDAEEALAKYYNVNRGEIGNNISILDNFKVVIIAGATDKFTEIEKYILDQYLMKGGSIFLLVDGVYISYDDLSNNGFSASIKNETNLDDLFFTYGIRIQPVLLQDAQSSSIVIDNSKDSQPVTIPWYYSPLLLPSPKNVITKHISNIKAEFVSSIDFLTNSSSNTENSILLSTSNHTHIVKIPEAITFDISKIQSDATYFNESYIPVSASLEGSFQSAFENRAIPYGIIPSNYKTITRSKMARIIVAASSDIIRNNIIGEGENTQIVPMGFDHISRRQYGNKDFIINAVNWLSDSNEIQELRSKTRQLNLLNKQLIYENRNLCAVINIVIPILIITLLTLIIYIYRKRKYSKRR